MIAKRLAVSRALLTALFASGSVFADDLNPPPWRGEEGSTMQHWSFDTQPGSWSNIPPEIVNNPYGSPTASVCTFPCATPGWYDNFQGRQGVVHGDRIDLDIPNRAVPLVGKVIWLQVVSPGIDPVGTVTVTPQGPDSYTVTLLSTESTPLKDDWVYQVFKWQITPNPDSETMELTGKGGLIIDQIVVDTICTDDLDFDGIPGDSDNCPLTYNPDQADTDSDGVGDVCDPCTDVDGDGWGQDVGNGIDCPNGSDPDCDDVGGNSTDPDVDNVCDPSDNCDLYNPDQTDCQPNGVGDVCDIAYGTSDDCTGDGIPDECEPDCNGNGVADSCDIDAGTSSDDNANAVPDECERLYVDASATGADNGTSWEDAYVDFQDALDGAEPGSQITYIWVAGGTYKPDRATGDRTGTFQLVNGVALYGGFGGNETDLDQRDPVIHVTTLDGDIGVLGVNSDNAYHVVVGSGTDVTALLDGFAITGGNADGPGQDGYDRGGGIYNDAGSPTIVNCVLIANSAADHGGGMSNRQGSAPVVTDCMFLANTANAYGGGGMSNRDASNPVLTNCLFQENWAMGAGAMSNIWSSPMLTRCRFIENSATLYGGAIYNAENNPAIVNCTFHGNFAVQGNGGAMANDDASPTLINCLFSGNSVLAGNGAGVYNWLASTPLFVNCTFSENAASNNGGAVYDWAESTTILINSILWGNSDSGGTDESAQVYTEGGTAIVDYSCIQGWTGALGGTGNIGDDPVFIDPDGNDDIVGTDDDDLRLLPGSPSIDAADNTGVPLDSSDLDDDGDTTEPIPFDLDANPRFVDDPNTPDTGYGTPPIVDMGAYEFHCGDDACQLDEDSCNCATDCGAPPANEVPGATCDDGDDNDCDTLTDCSDPDCWPDSVCWVCGNTRCDPNEDSCNCEGDCGSPPANEVPGTSCDDSVDNDCDTLTDCDDPDCQVPFGDVVAPFCPPDCPQPGLEDIMCLLADFADGPPVSGCVGSVYSTDLAPCGGDSILDLDDILNVLDAFAQVFQCPPPCP